MRALRVDFVRDKFGKVWWTVVCIGLLVGLGAWGNQLQQKIEIREKAQERSAELQQSQKQSQIDANKPLSTQEKKLLQLANEINLDLNPIFAVVENINIAGALLKNMQMDKSSGTLRLEFQMEDPSRASEISQALNAGDESHPWVLERISTQNSSTSASANSIVGGPQYQENRFKAQGSWSIRLAWL